MTLTIFILGALTVILSIFAALKFNHYRINSQGNTRKLTTALSWQLLGEAIIGLGTLSFAFAAHVGWLESWSLALQSSIRLIMFFATAATTLHLYRTIGEIR